MPTESCALCLAEFTPVRAGNVHCSRPCRVRAADLRRHGKEPLDPGYYERYLETKASGSAARQKGVLPYSEQVHLAVVKARLLREHAERKKHPALTHMKVALRALRLAEIEAVKFEIRKEKGE